MWVLRNTILTTLIFCVHGLNFNQHKYEVQQDEIIFDYIDHDIVDISGEVSKVNATAGIVNVSITFKVAVPVNTKFGVKAFKLVNNVYRDSVIQFEKPLRDILEMEMFDLQSLWVTHARPPLIWPLEKGVTYTTIGWNPDGTQFPPNLPEGSYKVFVQLNFPNKRKAVVLYWFARAVYFKH